MIPTAHKGQQIPKYPYPFMNITTVALLSSTNRNVRTVHTELAEEMVRRGAAEPSYHNGRLHAIRLLGSLYGAMVGPCSKLTAHSYGCSRYVRRETIKARSEDGRSFVSTIYSFKKIDSEEQRLTFFGAQETV